MPETKQIIDGFLNDAFSGTRPITSQDMKNLVVSSMGSDQISFVDQSRKLSYNDTLVFLKFNMAMQYTELPIVGVSENGYQYVGKRIIIFNTTSFTHSIRSSADDGSAITFNGGNVNLLDTPPFSATDLVCDGTNWIVITQRKIIESTDATLTDIITRITNLEIAVTQLNAENFLTQASADSRYVQKTELNGKISYEFDFTAVSSVTIQHNLGFRPNVSLLIGGEEFEADVTWPDLNTIRVDMSVVTSGQIILS